MCHMNWYISKFSSSKMNSAMESSRYSCNVCKHLLENRCQHFNSPHVHDPEVTHSFIYDMCELPCTDIAQCSELNISPC